MRSKRACRSCWAACRSTILAASPVTRTATSITHALIDAILGAANLGDIGSHFPSGDERYRGASSLDLPLGGLRARCARAGWELVNADCVLVGEEPRIGDVRDEM